MGSRPPSPAGMPVIGNTLGFARDRFDFIDRARTECGDVFRADLFGLGEVCYLTHPDQIERVLKTDREAFGKSDLFRVAFGDGLLAVDGDQWERQRTVLGEFFYPDRIRSYADTMVQTTERRLDCWEDNEIRSLLKEMTALTLEVIFETLFDRPLEPGAEPELRRAAKDLNAYFTASSLVLPEWVPTPARRRFRRAETTLRAELRSLLDERAEEGGDDFLSSLARLRADPDASMDAETVVDQLVTFLFAGHETTALALTFSLYELGTNPSVRAQFHAELDSVLDGDRPTLATASEVPTTERVLREALRLYPPAHTIPRVTVRDVTLGGYELPEGTPTHIAVHSVHRDGRFYDDPRSFSPDRWLTTDPESKGYAYVPFGAGPRTCIGRQFALLEARLVLATVGRRFQIDPVASLELDPMMSTQPAGEVPVRIRKRR